MSLALQLAPGEPECDERLHTALGKLAVAPGELLARRELLRRTDTKFALGPGALEGFLATIADGYAALRLAGGGSIATYRSLYFDTPDLRCFHDHRRGRRTRHKIRIRHYPDRRVSFLEVKARRSELVTRKHRVEIPYGCDRLDTAARTFLFGHVGMLADELVPQMWIEYRRITLLALASNERVTIDLDLVASPVDGASRSLGTTTVVEVKQDHYTSRSLAIRGLAVVRARAGSPSKYMTAIAATRPGVRCNRLLPTLRAVDRRDP